MSGLIEKTFRMGLSRKQFATLHKMHKLIKSMLIHNLSQVPVSESHQKYLSRFSYCNRWSYVAAKHLDKFKAKLGCDVKSYTYLDNLTSLENLCLEINEQNNQGNVVINEEALLSYYERKSIFALSEEVLQEKRTIQQHHVNK
jgi:hypothetical protein